MTGPARSIGYACLLATAVGWALNWPGMKLLLREWPPLFSRGLAGVMAALLLLAIARWRGERIGAPLRALPSVVTGSFTNVFAWMGFSTIAMQWLNVGEAALIVYSMPLWATLLAWPIAGVRPTARDLCGLALGLGGLGVLLGSQGFAIEPGKLAGYALALAAAVLFALGNVLPRGRLTIPPVTLVAWQVGLACAVMLLIGVVFERPQLARLTATGAAVMVYMTVVAMGVCYLTWFETLRRLPAPQAATGMLLVPVVGILAAAAMLSEPLGVREVLAMALTLGGVALAVARPGPR